MLATLRGLAPCVPHRPGNAERSTSPCHGEEQTATRAMSDPMSDMSRSPARPGRFASSRWMAPHLLRANGRAQPPGCDAQIASAQSPRREPTKRPVPNARHAPIPRPAPPHEPLTTQPWTQALRGRLPRRPVPSLRAVNSPPCCSQWIARSARTGRGRHSRPVNTPTQTRTQHRAAGFLLASAQSTSAMVS